MPNLLLVDDNPKALEWLCQLARAEGFTVAQADSLHAARIQMSRLQPDIVLTGPRLPDGKGLDLRDESGARDLTEVVVLVKPVDAERLTAILRQALRLSALRAELEELRDELRRLGRSGPSGATSGLPPLTMRVGTTLEEASRRLIEATLVACGSKRKAADLLGISLKTLYNRLAAYKSEERDAA